MASVKKSLAISFADKYSVMLIQLVATLVLARLLTPEDVGLFSVGAVIVGFAHVIRDFGVVNYLIQEKELTTERIRSAFGVTLVISWGIAVVLYLISAPIADFYDEDSVKKVIVILSINFLFIPFSSTVMGLLRRELKFETIFAINFSNAVAHNATAMILAYLGFGFESLAWAAIAGTSVTVIVAIIKRPENTQFVPACSEFKRIFSFGSYSSGAGIVREAGLSISDMSLGKLQGFEAVGYYSRAMGFVNIFNYAVTAAIDPVVTPFFAKCIRENRALKGPYLRALDYFTVLAWPSFLFLLVFAYPMIDLLYGAQWGEAAPVAQLLCIAFMLRSLTNFSGYYLIATGQIRLMFTSQLFLQVPRVILTILAAFDGLILVAAVQVLFYLVSFFVYHILVHRDLHVRYVDVFRSTYKSLMVALIAIIPPLGMSFYIEISGVFLIGLTGLLFIIGWVLSLYLIKHALLNELPLRFRRFIPIS